MKAASLQQGMKADVTCLKRMPYRSTIGWAIQKLLLKILKIITCKPRTVSLKVLLYKTFTVKQSEHNQHNFRICIQVFFLHVSHRYGLCVPLAVTYYFIWLFNDVRLQIFIEDLLTFFFYIIVLHNRKVRAEVSIQEKPLRF